MPERGYKLEKLSIAGMRGNGIWRWLTLPLVLLRAFGQSISLIRQYQPAVVAGFGGYRVSPAG